MKLEEELFFDIAKDLAKVDNAEKRIKEAVTLLVAKELKGVKNKFIVVDGPTGGYVVRIFNMKASDYDTVLGGIYKLADKLSEYKIYLMPHVLDQRTTKRFYKEYYDG